MRAEYRICSIFHIRVRIIVDPGNDFLWIMTYIISFQSTEHSAKTAGIRRKFFLISPHLRHRRLTGQYSQPVLGLRPTELSAHLLNICHGPPHGLQWQFHPEFVIWLQQDSFRFTQSLPHRAVRRLTEIAAFGMLLMSPSTQQRDLQIRHRGPGQRAFMVPLFQMGKDQPLPVPIQYVFSAVRSELHAGAAFARFQKKMDFRIVAEWFKMSCSLSRSFYGFLIYDIPLAKLDENSKTLFYKALQYFRLYFAHKLNMDLSQLLFPLHMKFWLLFFQLAKILQHHMSITALRQFYTISKDRLQNRNPGCLLHANTLSRTGSFQTGDHADSSCLHLGKHLVFLSRIDPDLIYFSLDPGQSLFYTQTSSRHFQPGQSFPLSVSGNLVHFGPELCRIQRNRHILCQAVQKSGNPPGLQS